MIFDLEKYGFTQLNNLTFIKRVEGHEITVHKEDNRFSIFINSFRRQHRRCIAEEYRCDTQEQLDFLILNGAAEYFFVPS